MQLNLVVPLSGTVLGRRFVRVEARAATDSRPATEPSAYRVADLLVAGVELQGELQQDLATPVEVSYGVGESLDDVPTQGEALELWVRPYVAWRRARGRSYPIVGYRFVAPQTTAAVLRASA